jgi:hypothetical protein
VAVAGVVDDDVELAEVVAALFTASKSALRSVTSS